MRHPPIPIMFQKMDNEEYWTVSELERNGKPDEAFQLLMTLVDSGHPMALMDLSMRYYSIEGYAHPVHPLEPDHKKSEDLAKQAKARLEDLASNSDGEAMRMLAYCYLGHWGPYVEKNIDQGEKWLLRAYEADCFVAANDLATFYQSSDIEKAKFYYREAERHNCRMVQNDNLET